MVSYNIKKIIAGIVAGCALSSTAYADDKSLTYEISITNLTNAPFLSEPVVAIHDDKFKLFELGKPNVSPGLEVVAETGVPGVLVDELSANESVLNVRYLMGGAPNGGLMPGETVTGTFEASKNFSYVSVYSMIAPSNDAFISANAVAGPYKEKSVVVFSPAYDAGTEANNELCDRTPNGVTPGDPDSIPVPPMMRPMICVFNPVVPFPAAMANQVGGPILIHRGFQGVGDLNPAMFDWRNPTAKIMIKRVSRR
ncbi:hypothetical protein MNBD_GAMMA09-442 [hydrothermal vent metagenome]|uniref:Spondin domain-containing protein n=1 Tax=hydrothermal vent metagenome TaxID=652676 RepID=A0A3B0XH98_9ZZZZ